MKTTSLLLIALAILHGAMLRLKSYRDRIDAKKTAVKFIRGIKLGLSVENAPMQEMFQSLARRYVGTESLIFEKISEDMVYLGEKSFSQIWAENICVFFPDLSEDEKTELINLGTHMGLCPLDMQLAYTNRFEEFLAERLRQENLYYPQAQKLYLGLSAAAAAAVIIVFI